MRAVSSSVVSMYVIEPSLSLSLSLSGNNKHPSSVGVLLSSPYINCFHVNLLFMMVSSMCAYPTLLPFTVNTGRVIRPASVKRLI